MKKFLALTLCLLLLTGCGKKQEPTVAPTTAQKVTTAATTAPTEATTEATTQKEILPTNPLTGIETKSPQEILDRKPVAVMIGNSKDSLPQEGISQADILFEMMAEGGITRLMAIFQDPTDLEKLGSVRSARPYFIDIAQSYDAYFIHFGGSVPAYEAIAKRGDLVNLDGIRGGYEGNLLVRDSERRAKFSLEHTVVTNGEKINTAIANFKNSEKRDLSATAFNFDLEHDVLQGTDISKITIDYFSMNQPTFTYDEDSGKYNRMQHKVPHYDATYDENIAVKNLFILEMPFEPVVGDPLKIVEVQTVGSGNGKYFCDGKYVDITWSKKAYNAPLVLKNSDGNELKVCPGNSFVAVIKTNGKITME